MPYAELDRNSGFYAVAGAAAKETPAVLIHGAGGSHLDWPPPLRRLPQRLTYAIDLPGHGRTPQPGRQSIAAYGDWVLALLEALALPPAILIGHSMGSAIALDLALKAPSRVAGLVLIGAGARLPVSSAILNQLLTAHAETVGLIADWAYGPNIPDEVKRIGRERMLLVEPAVLHGDFVACDRFNMIDRLGQVLAPVLLLCGSEDRMTPAKYSTYLRDHLPRAELVLVPGAGHMVTFECTDEVMEAVGRFLELFP